MPACVWIDEKRGSLLACQHCTTDSTRGMMNYMVVYLIVLHNYIHFVCSVRSVIE